MYNRIQKAKDSIVMYNRIRKAEDSIIIFNRIRKAEDGQYRQIRAVEPVLVYIDQFRHSRKEFRNWLNKNMHERIYLGCAFC